MKKILSCVPVTDMGDFKKLAMERLGWSIDRFYSRCNGRAKLQKAEYLVLLDVLKELGLKTPEDNE